MSRELGIIFCQDMVRAIRDGRKTQTRRLIPGILPAYNLAKKPESYGSDEYAFVDMADPVGSYPIYAKPRYQVGDLLWVRRLWLRVLDVKEPQRIRDISEEDAIAEGIYSHAVRAAPPLHSEVLYVAPGVTMTSVGGEREKDVPCHHTARAAFRVLWDSLHKKPGERWEDNPWVFPYVFKIIEEPK